MEAMEKAFGSRPEDILVGIGPSICQDCYEVSEDVAEAFRNLLSGEEMKKVKTMTEEQILKDKRNGKYQLDLWKANEAVCLSAGIRPEHISVTDICTCCNPGYLFPIGQVMEKRQPGDVRCFKLKERKRMAKQNWQ